MLPGSALERLLCSFSPNADALAVASPDGRIRTYDTGTGRLRVSLPHGTQAANGHLAEVHTCFAWLVKAKAKKKQAAGAAAAIATGTVAGNVTCYDTQSGEQKWRSLNCVEGGVTSLASSSSQPLLLATGHSCQLCTLDPESGDVVSRFEASKYPITCIALTTDEQHVLGGRSTMSLWGLASQERLAKYTGHPTEVRAIAVEPSGGFAVSAASGERHVALWQLPSRPFKKSKKQHAAVATLSIEDPAVQLDTCPATPSTAGREDGSETDALFYVAAVSEAGEAFVWRVAETGTDAGGVAGTLLARVRVGQAPSRGAAAGRDECILAVRLRNSTAGPSLLVARGSSAKPVCETVSLPQPGSGSAAAAVISLQPVGGVLLGSSGLGGASDGAAGGKSHKASAQHAAGQATVLGPENLGAPVLLPRVADAAGPSGRKRGAPADEEGGEDAADAGVSGQGQQAEADDDVPELPEGEVPLGDRVAALEARLAGEGPQAGGDDEAGPSTAPLPLPQGSAKADSLSVLLTQALRSNDRVLLERCLATGNATVVNNTVARIMPMDAALFLRAAVDRLTSKPARAVQLAPWIRALLHHHTGYLMTAPGAQQPLTALYQAIEARVKLHEPMLKVFGRLGLIAHHTARDGSGAARDVRPAAEVVLEDDVDADDEPEAENPFAPGAGAGADDDDDDDGDDESGEGEDEGEDAEDDDGDDDDMGFGQMLAGGRANGSDDGDDDDDDL